MKYAMVCLHRLPRGYDHAAQYMPGMYAIEMVGELPDEVIEHCENLGLPYKANKAAQKLK